MNYINVCNLSSVSRHFYQLCHSNKNFDKKMLMSTHMIPFDNGFFDFLFDELRDLSSEIMTNCSDICEKNLFFLLLKRRFKT